jgi:hypothetical protein
VLLKHMAQKINLISISLQVNSISVPHPVFLLVSSLFNIQFQVNILTGELSLCFGCYGNQALLEASKMIIPREESRRGGLHRDRSKYHAVRNGRRESNGCFKSFSLWNQTQASSQAQCTRPNFIIDALTKKLSTRLGCPSKSRGRGTSRYGIGDCFQHTL